MSGSRGWLIVRNVGFTKRDVVAVCVNGDSVTIHLKGRKQLNVPCHDAADALAVQTEVFTALATYHS